MKKKLISALCGLFMGIVPSNRVSSGLISEIFGTVLEGAALVAYDFRQLPVVLNRLFHTVFVSIDEIKTWTEDDLKRCYNKEILVYGDTDEDPKVFEGKIFSKFNCLSRNDFEQNYNVEFSIMIKDGCRRGCVGDWMCAIINIAMIPDVVGRCHNIYADVKSDREIKKYKYELDKYQKIHDNNQSKKGLSDYASEK